MTNQLKILNLSQINYVIFHLKNHVEFDAYVVNKGALQGERSVTSINGSGNPFGSDDHFLTIFTGDLSIPANGDYSFAVDGDDAVELLIDGNVVVGWYGGHGMANNASHNASVYLTAGTHSLEFRQQENTGDDGYALYWGLSIPASTITDYQVRVEVCKAGYLEENCEKYPSGDYKPTGLLHQYGEDGKMLFGLLTGSYANNTQGGVLRKAVSSFADEVDSNTGQFSSTVGIVKTIDRLKTIGFGGNYEYSCGWISTQPMANGQCSMWGNPVAEMMYEGVRYFSGESGASSDFAISASGNDDATLGLPLATWSDPYAAGNNPVCAKPFELVISDINPSYDSDSLPGRYSGFGSGSYTGDLASGSPLKNLNVEELAGKIWEHEFGTGSTKKVFIGQSGSTYDGAPTPKTVSSFGDIRGLSPEEPTKQGSYYAASIANFARNTDLNNASDDQKLSTFAVALASPLPQLKFEVAGRTVTLVPFAKSIGGSGISSAEGDFQPTNTIVDYYIEDLTPTSGTFRINFEDMEQGADHDMDAIVKYHYQINDNGTASQSDDTLTISLDSIYAAGSIIQHIGYVISGTTSDGTYLEVRDKDTAEASDPDYFLDTPPGENPGGNWADSAALPVTATRTFSPSADASAAIFLKDPLWYAAKYGLFDDSVSGAGKNNGMPDAGEWDLGDKEGNGAGDGVPDNYFLVTNALTLNEQLDKAFADILGRSSSAAALSTNSSQLDADTYIFQARFNSEDWSGQLLAFNVHADGTVNDKIDSSDGEWDAAEVLDALSDPNGTRKIYTFNPLTSAGTGFAWNSLNADQQTALNSDGNGALRVAYLRGEQCNEVKNKTASATTCGNGIFRNRTSILGDIVNSDPWYVGQQNYGYTKLPGNEGTSYLTYRTGSAYLNRTKMVYVGGNDGMLHAFVAGKRDLSATPQKLGGNELFAFVPNGVIEHLSELSSPAYSHRYYVDGPPRATDAYVDLEGDSVPNWETILVGSLGAGGKGIYALRVTDPDHFSASDVLWEIDSNTSGFSDLGYVLDQPFIVRMANGKWAAVFGNGYGSTSGHAVLYIVNLTDGSLIKSVDVGGSSNGLSGVAPVDFDNNLADGIVDYLYAGDLNGQMWKFDLTSGNPSNWDSAYKQGSTPAPLFVTNNNRPITARPEVSKGPDAYGGMMVYFGTGKFFEVGDNVLPDPIPADSFYGIWDAGSPVEFANLVQQEIYFETTKEGYEVRLVTDNDVNLSDANSYPISGWYLNLVSPILGNQGERVVDRPLLVGEHLVFTTLIPSQDVCSFGGDGWLMELNPFSGGRLPYSVFDLNGDNRFDENDYAIDNNNTTQQVSGKKSKEGIITTPSVINNGDKDYKLTSTSSGTIETTVEKGSGLSSGRGSWRQVR